MLKEWDPTLLLVIDLEIVGIGLHLNMISLCAK